VERGRDMVLRAGLAVIYLVLFATRVYASLTLFG
jgi:hypothetical protein